MKIFLSYAREDGKSVEAVKNVLKSEGHEVFFDKDALSVGGRFHKQIRDEIGDSDLFIAFISPATVDENSYTLSEINTASELWGNPEGHVLAFVLPPYKISEIHGIPSYLVDSTTIKEIGNSQLAEEVARAVENEAKKHAWENMKLSFGRGYKKGNRFGNKWAKRLFWWVK